jgi:hypothetical protein
MKSQWIVVPLLLVAAASWAADTTPAPADSKTTDSTAAKPAPKKPGMMEKTGNAVKSGYHKTVHTLKKHGRKAPCTQAEKSMHQCGKT